MILFYLSIAGAAAGGAFLGVACGIYIGGVAMINAAKKAFSD